MNIPGIATFKDCIIIAIAATVESKSSIIAEVTKYFRLQFFI